MNSLYQFDLAALDGRRSQMMIAAGNAGEAIVALRVAVDTSGWAADQPPRDVTDEWLSRDGVRSILKAGTIGVVSQTAQAATPQQMVEAMLRGERPRLGQPLVQIRAIPGFSTGAEMSLA